MKSIIKKTISLFLAFIIVIGVIPLTDSFKKIFVSSAEAASSSYTVIWSPKDLNKIRNNLSGNYILANDIDMSNFGNWTPIGSDSTPFTGTLDGNGHSILNLTIDLHIDVPNGGIPVNAALFANVNGGIIKNLGMENADVSYFLVGSITNELTFCNASGFVGELVNSSIINCFFTGSVSAQTNYNSYVRASAFGNCVGSTITNCYSNADLSAKADYANTMVGGIASWNDSTTIDKCYAAGTIYAQNTKSYVYCGGLVGSGSGTVSNSLALLDSITTSGTSVVTGTNLADTICAFSTLKNNKALNALTSSVPNKSASLISLSQAKTKSTYTAMGWDFSAIWKIEGGYPELITNKEKYEEKLNNLEEMSTAELSNSQINNYINQHLNFTASNTYSEMLDYYRFENNLADKEDFYNKIAAAVTWDLIGDVGEMASLNFDDLTLCENPYTIVLADLITSYTASQTLEAACYNEALDVFDDTYDNFMKAIRTSNEWDESLAPKIEIEVKGVLTDPNYRIQDKESFDVLKKILKGWSSDEIGEVFNLLNVANDIFDVVDTIGELDSAFTKAINAYVTASAFQTVSEEFVSTLIVIAYEMEPISSALFTDALGNYLDLIDGESAFNYALNNLGASLSWTAYDLVVKKLVQNISYSFVATAFGCAPSAVGIVVFAYNTTYSILNKISALGEKADLLYLIDAARQIENGLYTNTLSAASSMQSDPTLSSAELFDCRWGMLCALQKYEYNCATKYASKAMSTRFYKLFNPNYENSDMKIATELSGYWENTKCHGNNIASSKVCSVECPTNVIVRNSMDEIVLQIEGDNIIHCSEGIVVLVGEEHKYFSLPCNEVFDVVIFGTDEGTMNYSITEVMGSSTVREIKYQNLPLTSNTSYSGNVSEVIYEQIEEYNLKSSDETISCDADSINTDGFTCNDLDWDNDGLTNLEEYEFGTNPLLPDTDGDNVYDIIEIRNDLNPLETMADGEIDDYAVVYGNPDIYIDETSFILDETNVTCTISNRAKGKAMRTHIYLYDADGELIKLHEVNIDSYSSVDYSFPKEYFLDGMKIVVDEEKITRDNDYSNNEFTYISANSITAVSDEIYVTKNSTGQFEYTLNPINASKLVAFKSLDNSIASVDLHGIITGLKLGTTQITATTITGYSCVSKIIVEPFPGAGETDFECCLINNNTEVKITGYVGNDTELVIPNSIGGYPVTTIASNAFAGQAFTSILIPSTIKSLDYSVFLDLIALESIVVEHNNPYFSSESGVLFNVDKTKLIKYPIANESTTYSVPNTVMVIGKHAFDGSSELLSVSLPETITEIDSTAIDNTIITDIYYAGSRNSWNRINFGDIALDKVDIHFGKFTVTFVSENETISEVDYLPGDIIAVPDEPIKPYYYFIGWTPEIPESMPEIDLSFIAVFNAIPYTATFMDGDMIIGTDEFTIADSGLDYPSIPEKQHYEWVWEEHSIIASDITVSGKYVPIEYTANFIVDGTIISTQTFTIEAQIVTEPEIPQKEGYIARWSAYTLNEGNVNVYAKYDAPAVYIPSQKTLKIGETFRVLPISNFTTTDKSWYSSNESVAVVNDQGKITAVSQGICYIYVVCSGTDSLGNHIEDKASIKIIVNAQNDATDTKTNFRAMFDEFFEVTLHEILAYFKQFMLVLLRYAYN